MRPIQFTNEYVLSSIIEVTENKTEPEEQVIEVKNEVCTDFPFRETYFSNQIDCIDGKVPATKTISISDDNAGPHFYIARKKQTISLVSLQKKKNRTSLGNEELPKSHQEKWASEIQLRSKSLSEEDKKQILKEVDPRHLQWVEKLKVPERCQFPQHFAVDSFAEVENILAKFEDETFSRLLVTDVNGGFRHKSFQYSGEPVHFRERGKKEFLFNGVPFAMGGRLTYRCHQSFFGNKKSDTIDFSKKIYNKYKTSKKKNCPYKITVIKTFVFPEYKVEATSSPTKLYEISRFIKSNKEKMRFLIKFVFTIPSVFDHRNHQLGDESVSREAVDKRMFDKIEEFILAGVTKAPDIKELLRNYIQHDLKIDPSQWERRKYNPSLKDIRAKVYRTLSYTKIKRETVEGSEKKRESSDRKLACKIISKSPKIINVVHSRDLSDQLVSVSTVNVKREADHSEEDLQTLRLIRVSEGNGTADSDIHDHDRYSLHNDSQGDSERKKSIEENLSILDFLSTTLRHGDLAALETDIAGVVTKWRGVLKDWSSTTMVHKDRKRKARIAKKATLCRRLKT